MSVVVEKELVDMLRIIPAEMINESKENISFSSVVNQVLKEGLK